VITNVYGVPDKVRSITLGHLAVGARHKKKARKKSRAFVIIC